MTKTEIHKLKTELAQWKKALWRCTHEGMKEYWQKKIDKAQEILAKHPH